MTVAFRRASRLTLGPGYAMVTQIYREEKTMRTLRLCLLNALLLLAIDLLLPGDTFAQTGAASLTGIVTDQSGAAVPGATVTATNQATNVGYSAVATEAGNYTITSLPVGTYIVKAELSNFKTATTKPIQLEAKQIGRL